MPQTRNIVIVGAGVAGLAAAMRLAHAGHSVHVYDSAPTTGGKIRTTPSFAGPVDIGPTVLTMRWVFEDLFRDTGSDLNDHLSLTEDHILARHWWGDGSTLDLFQNRDQSRAAVQSFAGARAAREFTRFSEQAEKLFQAFRGPMMETARPGLLGLTATVLSDPTLIRAMAPLSTLSKSLAQRFEDPRLRQLFGRYATYVGGSPFQSPALLSLIAHSEALGVWSVQGGMAALAAAMTDRAASLGVRFHLGTPVQRLRMDGRTVVGVETPDGYRPADIVVFNGDPAALQQGQLGSDAAPAASRAQTSPRSLSAWVWGFAARPSLDRLVHHNVFFGDDPKDEFGPIDKGRQPNDPTLYICAQDRGGSARPIGPERFEIIMNGAPTQSVRDSQKDRDQCRNLVFGKLTQFGLTFDPTPPDRALTSPADFNRRFPASQGSLYGRSPHGMTAALKRPTARTAIRGLYLAGGGAHPGAGIPMATLSARHVADTIAKDLSSTLMFRRTVTPGGMSTA